MSSVELTADVFHHFIKNGPCDIDIERLKAPGTARVPGTYVHISTRAAAPMNDQYNIYLCELGVVLIEPR